jgi:hypothetical protein
VRSISWSSCSIDSFMAKNSTADRVPMCAEGVGVLMIDISHPPRRSSLSGRPHCQSWTCHQTHRNLLSSSGQKQKRCDTVANAVASWRSLGAVRKTSPFHAAQENFRPREREPAFTPLLQLSTDRHSRSPMAMAIDASVFSRHHSRLTARLMECCIRVEVVV